MEILDLYNIVTKITKWKLYTAAVLNLFGAKDKCSNENVTSDDLRWSHCKYRWSFARQPLTFYYVALFLTGHGLVSVYGLVVGNSDI